MAQWNPFEPPENGLPPSEVRFIGLKVEPWPDGKKIKVHLEITPFLERPNIHAAITDAEQREVASIDIVESIEYRMTFTMHIRAETINGNYQLTASLHYPEIGIVAQDSVVFETSDKTT